MNSKIASSDKKQIWYKSPWLVGWLLLVIIVLSVNAYMIFESMNRFPGLVVNDFYDRGQNYEENIKKKLENNEKWQVRFQLERPHQGKPAPISVIIKDKQGALVQADKVTMLAYRPADAQKDFSAAMVLAENKQAYQVTMTFSEKGKWDLIASAVIDGIEVNYAKTIYVKD